MCSTHAHPAGGQKPDKCGSLCPGENLNSASAGAFSRHRLPDVRCSHTTRTLKRRIMPQTYPSYRPYADAPLVLRAPYEAVRGHGEVEGERERARSGLFLCVHFASSSFRLGRAAPLFARMIAQSHAWRLTRPIPAPPPGRWSRLGGSPSAWTSLRGTHPGAGPRAPRDASSRSRRPRLCGWCAPV